MNVRHELKQFLEYLKFYCIRYDIDKVDKIFKKEVGKTMKMFNLYNSEYSLDENVVSYVEPMSNCRA